MGAVLLFVAVGLVAAHLVVTVVSAFLRAHFGSVPVEWSAHWFCALLGLQVFYLFMMGRWNPSMAYAIWGASAVTAALALRGGPDRPMLRVIGLGACLACVGVGVLVVRDHLAGRSAQVESNLRWLVESGDFEALRSTPPQATVWCDVLSLARLDAIDVLTPTQPQAGDCERLIRAAERGDLHTFEGAQADDQWVLRASVAAAWKGHPEIPKKVLASVSGRTWAVAVEYAFRVAWVGGRDGFAREFFSTAGLADAQGHPDASFLIENGGETGIPFLMGQAIREQVQPTPGYKRPIRPEADFTRWVLGHFDVSDVLVAAAAEGDLKRVTEYLAKKGIDVNHRSVCGVTPLGAAVQSQGAKIDGKPAGNQVEQVLLAHGADPNLWTGLRFCDPKDSTKPDRKTPLGLVRFLSGNPRMPELERMLVKAGAH
jgi:hypothetical protein